MIKQNSLSSSIQSFLTEDEELTPGQLDAIQKITNGENVFITGGAGTGKSFIVKILKRIYEDDIKKGHFVITSTTGRSAVDIGGRTVQNFAGFQTGEEGNRPLSFDVVWDKFGKRPNTRLKWANLKILLIDEISILGTHYFRLLDQFARRMKLKETNEHSPHYISPKSMPPFGGVQMILMGDFFQLPPVGHEKKPINDRFCFQTTEWKDAISDNVVCLTISKRCPDLEFTQILDRIRWGTMTQDDIYYIGRRQMANPDPQIEPTMLYSVNRAVAEFNQAKIDEIKRLNDCVSVYCKQAVDFDNPNGRSLNDTSDKSERIAYEDLLQESTAKQLNLSPAIVECAQYRMDLLIKDSNINIKAPLSLAKEIRVMLIVNYSTRMGLCNGSIGQIVGYAKVVNPPPPNKNVSKPKIVNREGAVAFVYKNKKYTGSEMFISSNRLYTVEKFRHRGGLVEYIHPNEPIPKIETFTDTPILRDDICPIVYFESADKMVIVGRYTWQGNDVVYVDEYGNKISQKRMESGSLTRIRSVSVNVFIQQFPLQLCWALTTHKAQGMSLDPVCVDVGDAFDGQLTYVALSRARSPQTLFIKSINYTKINPYQEVKNFYLKYQSQPQ